jgi:BirA family biotin operon repressor/biotin-[acetyl-CoA-carboxylase] ligase
VVKAIACTVSLVADLKWPNDVLIKGKKVCGILSLSSSSKEGTDHVIIGVGINANSRTGDLSPELSGTAPTLRDELGSEVDLDELLRNILYFMDLNYSAFMDGQTGELLEEWSLRSSTLMREVRVTTPSGTVEGTALGVDSSGALMIKTTGGLTRVLTGDCSHIERS